MGFRQDCYATVWSAEPSKTGKTTKVRISTSRKNKETDSYEQDFSGFCKFIGAAHEKAGSLKEKDRIKITRCEVTTNYDREANKEYVNYCVFDFDTLDGSPATKNNASPKKKAALVDDGEVEPADDLPF